MQPCNTTFRPVAVIPVYDHWKYLAKVVDSLIAADLFVILVNDGSHEICHKELLRLSENRSSVLLLDNAVNRGKGEATVQGMRRAAEMGYTHALQVDADGQHDLGVLPAFLSAARSHTDACICGYPLYDESVPKARLYGRRVTNLWVHINTLSCSLRDAMCGFRVYPLQAVMRLLQSVRLGGRMEFDPEIAVRLQWIGVPIVNLPVRVTYPCDGVSHFRAWKDNWRISCMHARLCCGMLFRLPILLRRSFMDRGS